MTAAILGSALLALLSAWGLAFRHDAWLGRRRAPAQPAAHVRPPRR